jgi:hypothetical protein
MAQDQGYVDWLMGQEWFRNRYRPIYQVVVNNFGAPAETPDHNALQARFLDDDFCVALATTLEWEFITNQYCAMAVGADQAVQRLKGDVESCQKQIDDPPSWYPPEKKEQFIDGQRAAIKKINRQIDSLTTWEENQPFHRPNIYGRAFEVETWDVRFDIAVHLPYLTRDGHTIFERLSIAVEIKPSLGDDYPAILRQMKAASARSAASADYQVLVFDNFAASGASLSQVRQIFAASKFLVVSIEDIEEAIKDPYPRYPDDDGVDNE